MRSLPPRQPESPERAIAQNGSRASACRGCHVVARHRPALLAVSLALLFAATSLQGQEPASLPETKAPAAQTPTTQAPAPAPVPTHPHKKPAAAKPAVQTAQAPALALAPAAPQIPNWPANNKPAEASVVWDSRGLLIQASNSSLDQILNDISLRTGAKVEGMGADERVFGTYGPGPARDVLTELLEGTGYNVLLVGDLGQGTPRRIVLSGRPTGAAQPSGQNNPAQNEGDQDDQVTATEPQPSSQPEPPPVPARSPEPMIPRRSELMQQPQQQNNPPNPQ